MEKYEKGFRNLIAWQKSHTLTIDIYRMTKDFPSHERFGLVSQMCRASSSIAAQLAEGSRMPTQQHRKLYYDRAYASAAEIDYFLELAKDLQYIDKQAYSRFLMLINEVSALIYKLSLSCMPKASSRF